MWVVGADRAEPGRSELGRSVDKVRDDASRSVGEKCVGWARKVDAERADKQRVRVVEQCGHELARLVGGTGDGRPRVGWSERSGRTRAVRMRLGTSGRREVDWDDEARPVDAK